MQNNNNNNETHGRARTHTRPCISVSLLMAAKEMKVWPKCLFRLFRGKKRKSQQLDNFVLIIELNKTLDDRIFHQKNKNKNNNNKSIGHLSKISKHGISFRQNTPEDDFWQIRSEQTRYKGGHVAKKRNIFKSSKRNGRSEWGWLP